MVVFTHFVHKKKLFMHPTTFLVVWRGTAIINLVGNYWVGSLGLRSFWCVSTPD